MNQSSPIRVMIVDDHRVVRSGLATFLLTCEDMELVGEAADGEQALRLCPQVRPNVVLMDLVMPGMDGATATRQIRAEYPDIQVIILTSFKDQDLVQGALQAGAIGYLLKDVTAEELANAVRAAHVGRPTLAPEAAQALIEKVRYPEQKVGFDLTEREREVLALMAQGMNNNEIAKHLVVSLSTAKFHVSSILSKLGVTSRTEAVVLAINHNLVD